MMATAFYLLVSFICGYLALCAAMRSEEHRLKGSANEELKAAISSLIFTALTIFFVFGAGVQW